MAESFRSRLIHALLSLLLSVGPLTLLSPGLSVLFDPIGVGVPEEV